MKIRKLFHEVNCPSRALGFIIKKIAIMGIGQTYFHYSCNYVVSGVILKLTEVILNKRVNKLGLQN